TRAPRPFVEDQLRDGTFEQVLPEYNAPDKDVFEVFPSRHSIDRRRERVIDGLTERQTQIHRRAAQPRPATIIA
ncbi:MAG: LysR family transcriptional regulator, partial [Phaeobacter gallaeciensis]